LSWGRLKAADCSHGGSIHHEMETMAVGEVKRYGDYF